MANPTQEQANRFVAEVDKFMANYALMNSSATKREVYSSGNNALISDYENSLAQAGALKSAIETTTGAWGTAKRVYANITDETSMVIGDAIDEIRSWFGYKPAGGLNGLTSQGLGALQLPAAAWMAGIVSAAYILNKTMDKIFIAIEASKIQRQNPNISRGQALAQAAQVVKSQSIFGGAMVPLGIAAAVAIWLVLK